MTHDRFCPLDSLPEADCVICDDLKAARDEVRRDLNDTWQHVLRENEKRGYARGWQDGVNGKPAAP